MKRMRAILWGGRRRRRNSGRIMFAPSFDIMGEGKSVKGAITQEGILGVWDVTGFDSKEQVL